MKPVRDYDRRLSEWRQGEDQIGPLLSQPQIFYAATAHYSDLYGLVLIEGMPTAQGRSAETLS